jgi:hypothetical protein
MLPIVEYDGRSWFMDARLGQFRDVWNPSHFVDFDTEEGRRMLAVEHAKVIFRDLP